MLGKMKIILMTEMMAPLAKSSQRLEIKSIRDIKDTPIQAAKKEQPLVMIEGDVF